MSMPILDDEDLRQQTIQVGLVCGQWAYLEWCLELTHWWLIGLLNKQTEGRIITGGLSLETLAKRVCALAHLRITDAANRAALETIKSRLDAVTDERHLAVHGVRAIQPDATLTGVVARGKYKSDPQQLSLVRIRSLNNELTSIIDSLEPLLVGLGILQGTIVELRQKRSSQPGQ